MVTRGLQECGSAWPAPDYRVTTPSTQRDAADALSAGRVAPFAVVADEQTAGRGRLDRTWSAPANSSILCSVVVPQAYFPEPVPLSVGVLVVRALQRWEPRLRLKWPNDIVLPTPTGLRKLGGIIAEADPSRGVVTIGIGINVRIADNELPTLEAISLTQCGVEVSREHALIEMLQALELRRDCELTAYRGLCCTIGSAVRVTATDGSVFDGITEGIADTGALVVRGAEGVRTFLSGDAVHVRPGA